MDVDDCLSSCHEINPKNKLICENDMTRALAWNWLTLWLWAPGGGHFFCTYEPNWRRLGAGAFKMVVRLLPPQLSRFFHTVTVFDSPALPNNCHKRLIIHYRFFVLFFFWYKKLNQLWMWTRGWKACVFDWLQVQNSSVFFFFLLFS